MSGNKIIEESFNTQTSNNSSNDANVIKMRLDSQYIIENIELFLKNEKIVTCQDEAGNYFNNHIKMGRPKANDHGIQGILSIIQSVVNTANVQGNFPEDKPGLSYAYEQYIYDLDVSTTKTLMLNKWNWEISDEDFDSICDQIMLLAIPFMSRLIGNKERESYGDTIIHHEKKADIGSKAFPGFAKV